MITPNGNLRERVGGHIAGVVAAVPREVVSNAALPPGADEAAKLTGVRARRHARADQTTETLCLAAAQWLLRQLDWSTGSIDALVYVTQTPATSVPASAYGIHAALGLPAHCPAIEVNWSCAGYVYGLWLATKLAQGGGLKARRVLLLVGDTSSRIVDPEDRATGPLFGDAGSATAVQGGPAAGHMDFVLGSDGHGSEKLSQRRGGYLSMDGAAVFSFTLRAVPGLVDDVLALANARPDFLLFHQANRFMLDHLAKKMKLAEGFGPGAIPSNIERFGNCSCASIPLLLCEQLGMRARGARLALFGFGAGWAWAGMAADMGALDVVDLIEC